MTNHPTTPPAEPSIREQQLAAAEALVELLKVEDMPELSWDLSAHEVRLDGLVPSNQTEEARRDDVAFWADLFEVDVTENSGTYKDGVAWADAIAEGTFKGIRVRVWARFNRQEASA